MTVLRASIGRTTNQYAAPRAAPPSTRSTTSIPSTNGTFDFFLGGRAAGDCGDGANCGGDAAAAMGPDPVSAIVGAAGVDCVGGCGTELGGGICETCPDAAVGTAGG